MTTELKQLNGEIASYWSQVEKLKKKGSFKICEITIDSVYQLDAIYKIDDLILQRNNIEAKNY